LTIGVFIGIIFYFRYFMAGKIKDLTGMKFGRLLVISQQGWKQQSNGKRKPLWLCQCDCGRRTVAQSGNLGRSTNSCGCIKSEEMRSKLTKHGNLNHPIYGSWQAMKQRCYNPKMKAYHNYGGRGITVCDRWLDSFENFLEDMGERPAGMTLDRINNDGNYEPSNCKWSVRAEQSYNQRKSSLNKSGKTGVQWESRRKKWKATISFNGVKITLGYFTELQQAIDIRKENELKYYGVNRD